MEGTAQELKAVLRHGCTACRTTCSTTKVPDVKPGDALYLPPEKRVRIW